MKYYYDLHMHSCLSPCGDDDMTPNNIVNMAKLKGLDIISVTDHNATYNLPAVMKVAQEVGIFVVPGIEVNTAEEVHMLVYFSSLQRAEEFGQKIYETLADVPNNEEFFGKQQVMDENDEELWRPEKLLIGACNLTIDEVVRESKEFEGFCVPAHVNKGANSMLANLGFMPPHLHFPSVEVWKNGSLMGIDLEHTRLLYSSDAHNLFDINERENYLNLEKLDYEHFFQKLCTF